MIRLHLDLDKHIGDNPMTFIRVADGNADGLQARVTKDGTPVNLTGYSIAFEGVTSAGKTVIDNTATGTAEGVLSYTFTEKLAQSGGRFKSAYFSLTAGNTRTTTSNFELFVYSGADINGIDPADYINPYNDLIDRLNKAYDVATTSVKNNANAQIKATTDNANSQIKDLNDRVDALGKKIADYISGKTVEFKEFKADVDAMLAESRTKIDETVTSADIVHRSGDELIDGTKSFKHPVNALVIGLNAQTLTENADLNNLKKEGLYQNTFYSLLNAPAYFGPWSLIRVVQLGVTNGYQLFTDTTTNRMYIRSWSSTTVWSPWTFISADSLGTNLVYNSRYSNDAYGWSLLKIGPSVAYTSNIPSSTRNGALGLGINTDGLSVTSSNKFAESKLMPAPTAIVDPTFNSYSMRAGAILYADSAPEAKLIVTLAFFNSAGTRIGYKEDYADISTKDKLKTIKVENYPLPENTAYVAIQYYAYGSKVHGMVVEPMIIQGPVIGEYAPDTIGAADVDYSVRIGKNLIATDDLLTLEAGTYYTWGAIPKNAPTAFTADYAWYKVSYLGHNDTRRIDATDITYKHYVKIYAGSPSKWREWVIPNYDKVVHDNGDGTQTLSGKIFTPATTADITNLKKYVDDALAALK